MSDRPASPELTLGAALRDVTSPRLEARNLAVRNLAPALLDELDLRAPVHWSQIDHARREDVVHALERACEDAAPQNIALARVGLAQLGAPTARERALEACAWPESEGEDHGAATFIHECGVIALGQLGAGAREWLATPEAADEPRARAEARELVDAVLGDLRELLEDPRDDLRFQAGPALVAVITAGDPAEVDAETDHLEAELAAALAREQHAEVRENLIAALASFERPSPGTCDALVEVLESEEGAGAVGWEAALALAGARRPEAGARLLAALKSQSSRDRALEALAVIGPQLRDDSELDAARRIRRYTRGLLVPVFTRVRAAYALARVDPEAGEAALERLGKHFRPAVREAVDEARVNLAKLAEAEREALDPSAYRR